MEMRQFDSQFRLERWEGWEGDINCHGVGMVIIQVGNVHAKWLEPHKALGSNNVQFDV